MQLQYRLAIAIAAVWLIALGVILVLAIRALRRGRRE
jgi:hypothetical protein